MTSSFMKIEVHHHTEDQKNPEKWCVLLGEDVFKKFICQGNPTVHNVLGDGSLFSPLLFRKFFDPSDAFPLWEFKSDILLSHLRSTGQTTVDWLQTDQAYVLKAELPVQMQNEGSNGGHSCEQDLEKQGKSQEGLSVVGSGDEANQTLPTIVISNGETPEPNRTDENDSKDELPPIMSPKKGYLSRSPCSQCTMQSFSAGQGRGSDRSWIVGCQCRGGLAKAHRSCIDTLVLDKGIK